MMLIIRLLAGSLVWIVAFLHPVITHAAGTLNYDPSGAACNTTYKSMSVAQDKAVTLTCPAALANEKPFHIEYKAGLAGCSAYTTIENNTGNNTLTINCATAAQLFKIIPSSLSTAQNTVVTFNVSRLIDKVGNDTLTLSIPEAQGHFTTDATGVTPLSTPTQATVSFDGQSTSTQTIYAKITTSSGNVIVSATGRGSSGSIAIPSVSVTQGAQGCGATPANTTIIDIGELPTAKGFDDLYKGPERTQANKKWTIGPRGILAVKFSISATEPARQRYTFGFMETSDPLYPRKLAFSTCPGVFDHLAGTASCVYEQPSGDYSFTLLTPSFKPAPDTPATGICKITVPNTYYLNMITIPLEPPLDNAFYMTMAR